MSFGFAAIGTKDEVIAQLEAAAITTGEARFNEFGTELRDLIVKHFGHEHEHNHAGLGHKYLYVVKAQGHGGGTSPLSAQITIESHWVADTADQPEDTPDNV